MPLLPFSPSDQTPPIKAPRYTPSTQARGYRSPNCHQHISRHARAYQEAYVPSNLHAHTPTRAHGHWHANRCTQSKHTQKHRQMRHTDTHTTHTDTCTEMTHPHLLIHRNMHISQIYALCTGTGHTHLQKTHITTHIQTPTNAGSRTLPWFEP